MNKEEILKKAQTEKNTKLDERELQIANRGSSLSLFCILILAFIFMCIKIAVGQSWYDVYSMMFLSMGVSNLYRGIKLEKKREIGIGILNCVVAVFGAVTYILTILGIW